MSMPEYKLRPGSSDALDSHTVSSRHAAARSVADSSEKRPLRRIDLPAGNTISRFGTHAVQWRGRALRLAVPLLIVLIWQWVCATGRVAPQTLPSPADIVAAFREISQDGELAAAIVVSLWRAADGLAIGGGIGLILGLVAGFWKLGEEIADSPLQMLRTIPFIALIPLFITWFGIGEGAKLAVIVAACIVPMYLSTFAGVRGVDPKLIEAARMFGLGGVGTAWRIVLPTALPGILVGVRYASGVALLALVVAEQINAQNGIGYIVINANQNQRPDIIIAGIVVYAALGIVTDLMLRVVEQLALPWRARLAL